MRKLYMLLCALVLSFASYAIGPITGNLNVCVGNTTTLADTATGGTWTSGMVTVATVGSTTGIVSGLAAGTAEITYTTGTGSVTAIVTVHPTPSACPLPSACVGVADTLIGCVAPGYWSSPVVMVDTPSGKGYIIGATVGTTTVTYTQGVSGCVLTSVVTVNPGANAGTIDGNPTICVGNTSTFVDSIPGGVWTSSNSSVAAVGSTDGIVIGIAAGSATITYSVTSSCGTAMTTKLVNVVTTPSGGIISGPSSVCMGATITLTNSIAGGSWVSGSPANASVGSASGIVLGITTGSAVISYQITLSCGTGVSTKVITVSGSASGIHSSPGIPSTTDVHEVCIGNYVILTAGGAGTWSSSNPGVATMSTSSTVVGLTAGTATITHTLTSGCFATYTMTVGAPPAITGTTTFCQGSGTVLTGTPSGGTWISSTGSVAVVGITTGIVTSSTSPGTSTISYTKTGCTVTQAVTVYPGVTPITGPSSICEQDSVTLGEATAGGSWITSNPTIATIDSATGLLRALDSGVVTISYTVPGTGCIPTKSINVNPVPDEITGTTSMCLGATVTLSDSTTGGTWSTGTITAAMVGSLTGIVTGVAGGTANVTYILPTGCAAMTMVTVAPSAISGVSAIAVGQTTTYVNGTTGGAWGSSNTAVATIGATSGIVTGITQGTAIMTYQLTSGCYATKMITITHGVSVQEVSGGITQVYPNPTTGDLNIQWAENATGSATVSLTDVTGRQVYTSTVKIGNTATRLSLGSVADGIYFISVRGENVNYSARVSIEK